jgi:Clp amino terminal domain, pathogenicity island component
VNDRDRFDKFTERARKVLSLAQEEAQRFNHNYIGTEHLLLGLVREGDGVAAKVLSNLGVELNKVRSAVEHIIGRGDRIVLGDIGLTPRAKKVIELAVDEARRLNHHYIGTEHLLLGLVREGEGIAAGVLESLGLNLEKVRTQTIQVLSQTSQASQVTGGVAGEATHAGTAMYVPGLTPPLFPAPPFHDLLRVIAIAERQQHEDVTLTAVALEVYADGCLLTLLLRRVRAEPDPRDPFARLGQITVTMTDDHDHGYAGHVQGSNGGARPGFWDGRAQCAFTPTLDPAAGAVRIEITAIQWTYALETAQGEHQWVQGDVTPGPWIFSVRLPAAGT